MMAHSNLTYYVEQLAAGEDETVAGTGLIIPKWSLYWITNMV